MTLRLAEMPFTLALAGGLLGSALAPAGADETVSVAPLLQNGDFEMGQGERPEAWTPGGWAEGRSVFRWEPSGGVGGSRCVSIETAGEPNDSHWAQKVTLEPRTAYLLRGLVRGENVEIRQQDGPVGANLCQLGVWGCFSDPTKSTGTFDWTPFEVGFATGESGEVEVAGRLGHWYSVCQGKAWFDHLELVRDEALQRYEGEHVYLLLPDADVTAITPEHLRRWIAHLDAAYDAMADLVGRRPFGGARIGVYPPEWYPGGYAVAGNPIYWHRRYVREMLGAADTKDDWGFGLLHEIGHDFDEDGAWNFDGEFWANVKLYYAIETLNGRVGEYVGADHLRYWKAAYEKYWRDPDPAKRTAMHDGLQYLTLLMRQKAGWEPFQQTFRWFHALPEDQRPRTPWQRFQLFYNRLAEFSGLDVWSYFTPEDLERLKEEHPDR